MIPYHRGLHWLAQAIESILSQQSVDCHLHLINDASPEDDRWVRKRYSRFDNLSWYRNAESLGPFRSIHGVWDFLRSDFVAIQDADDISMPTRLWRALHALESHQCEIYGAAMEQFLDWDLADSSSHQPYLEANTRLQSGIATRKIPEGRLVNGTMVFRKTTFQALNGFADLFIGADTEFIVRAHHAGVRIYFDDATVALRRLHDHNLSWRPQLAVGTGQVIDNSEHLARVRQAASANGRASRWTEFGSLAKHLREGRTIRCEVAHPSSPPVALGSVRRLVPITPAASEFKYMRKEGFMGPEARHIPALLPLLDFPDFESYLASVGKNVRRDARLSARHGHHCRMFDPSLHAPDMIEIVQSKPHRQGRPMEDTVSPWLLNEAAPTGAEGTAPVARPLNSSSRFFGVFEPRPGYRQGPVETNEKLLAFIQLSRNGSMAFYTRILGHRDYLSKGVMFAIHLHVMEWLLRRTDEAARGTCALMYGSWTGRKTGMRLWKRRSGFVPAWIGESVPAAPTASKVSTAFPSQVLTSCRSAASFFCAEFGGRNDAAHYYRAGIDDVHLVDLNVDKLLAMHSQFSPKWRYLCGDAFEAASELRLQRTFDIVSCDQWSRQFERVADRHFRDFYDLARRFLLITVVPRWADSQIHSRDWFTAQGLDPEFYLQVRDAFSDLTGVNRRLSEVFTRRQKIPISVVEVVHRTNHLGGCYWIVIEK